jgi:hypothetical protein
LSEIRKMIDKILIILDELKKITESLYHADKVLKMADKI